MRSYTIQAADDGKRMDRWLGETAPGLGKGGVQKALRNKTARVNGKHVDAAYRLAQDDVVQLYLPDDVFTAQRKEDRFLRDFRVHLHILYEDKNLLLADKKPGLMAHPDDRERVNTLLTHIQAYLYQKGEYAAAEKGAFAPALCNRIDRFTGGLVIAAKNEETLKVMNRLIADRMVRKFYLSAIHGELRPREGVLHSYIRKPEGRRSVEVVHIPCTGAQEAETRYRTLSTHNGLSLVECELYTGRTHQIRAQMADAGHPLLGDQQYGRQELDAPYSYSYQALYAYRIDFAFTGDTGHLHYLDGKSFRVGRVAFADRLFPGFHL